MLRRGPIPRPAFLKKDQLKNHIKERLNGDVMKNTTKFFQGVNTLEELRKKYAELIKKNHPDNGGDAEITKEIILEYKKVFELLKSGATFTSSTASKEEQEKQAKKYDEQTDENIREAINKIIHLDGVNIEIVGSWIWCDGATFIHKDALKEAGFQWSKSRKKWHFTPYESMWHKGGKKTFEELRSTYGSIEIEKAEIKALSA